MFSFRTLLAQGKKLILAALLVLFHCGEIPLYPGTRIPITLENKEILKVVESYRAAFGAKNVSVLVQLADSSYSQASMQPGQPAVTHETLGAALKNGFENITIEPPVVFQYIRIESLPDATPSLPERRVRVYFRYQLDARPAATSDGPVEFVDARTRYERFMDLIQRPGGQWKIINGM